MKSTHVYAIINRMFSEKRTVGEIHEHHVRCCQSAAQDIICSAVKRTHLVNGIAAIVCSGIKQQKYTPLEKFPLSCTRLLQTKKTDLLTEAKKFKVKHYLKKFFEVYMNQ